MKRIARRPMTGASAPKFETIDELPIEKKLQFKKTVEMPPIRPQTAKGYYEERVQHDKLVELARKSRQIN